MILTFYVIIMIYESFLCGGNRFLELYGKRVRVEKQGGLVMLDLKEHRCKHDKTRDVH